MEALVTEVLGPYSVETAINDLNNQDVFFCFQTDASNKNNIKLFPLVVQYFSVNNGLQNKLLDFYENSNESAHACLKLLRSLWIHGTCHLIKYQNSVQTIAMLMLAFTTHCLQIFKE